MKSNEKWKTNDDFDRALDEVLAQYASVEPRAGLEERILANLRLAPVTAGARPWWASSVAAVLAVVLMIAALLMFWRHQWSQPPTVGDRAPLREAPMDPYLANREPGQVAKKKPRRRTTRPGLQHETVASGPKLDVFPSPLPLSEQEKLLAIYVGRDREHAALVAEARMADLRHEAEERQQIADGEQDYKQ
jgi:hypothetical protein